MASNRVPSPSHHIHLQRPHVTQHRVIPNNGIPTSTITTKIITNTHSFARSLARSFVRLLVRTLNDIHGTTANGNRYICCTTRDRYTRYMPHCHSERQPIRSAYTRRIHTLRLCDGIDLRNIFGSHIPLCRTQRHCVHLLVGKISLRPNVTARLLG